MKNDIHPQMHPTIFVDSSCGKEFITRSTLTSPETREIDGVKYFVHRMEISSASHPFYTGKHVLIDTARRAEKFNERAEKMQATSAVRKGKKAKREKKVIKKQADKEKKEKKDTVGTAEKQ